MGQRTLINSGLISRGRVSGASFARVRRADGDDLELLLQALDVRVEVSPEEDDVRVEVPCG